jgi:hypothetical protein
MSNRILLTIPLLGLHLISCSTLPQASHQKLSTSEAKAFLTKWCSSVGRPSSAHHELKGEVLVRSSTREFKGQYPASVHFSKEGTFVLEVTNLIGGTVAMLKVNESSIEIIYSSQPKFNRKGIKSYMGLPVKLLLQMLHGDLPCPDLKEDVFGDTRILVKDGRFHWEFERAETDAGMIPFKVKITEAGREQVDFRIEKWNQMEGYAEKVKVSTPEGELKWTWRSRDLE